jgi:DNA helicase-2/ATP-dependent DNA helicase PcrA
MFLPQFTGKKSAYITELKKRAEEDERRLFYVAITRAKQRLYCTAAHWYGVDEKKGPSTFLDAIAEAAALVEQIRNDEPSDENPVLDAMRADLHWPLHEPRHSDVAMVWIERVDAMRAGTLDPLRVVDDAGANDLYSEHLQLIDALRSETERTEPAAPVRRALRATDAVRISRGESADAVLRPLPKRPTTEQRIGIEVHAFIEEDNRGLIGLAEEEGIEEASLSPDRSTVAAILEHYKKDFAGRTLFELPSGEHASEVPFTLKLPLEDGDVVVRGRIDAVYTTEEGPLEIVDFKTGTVPEDPDWQQLELYAEALAALRLVDGEVILTFAYLQADEPLPSKRYTPRGLDWLREGLAVSRT